MSTRICPYLAVAQQHDAPWPRDRVLLWSHHPLASELQLRERAQERLGGRRLVEARRRRGTPSVSSLQQRQRRRWRRGCAEAAGGLLLLALGAAAIIGNDVRSIPAARYD